MYRMLERREYRHDRQYSVIADHSSYVLQICRYFVTSPYTAIFWVVDETLVSTVDRQRASLILDEFFSQIVLQSLNFSWWWLIKKEDPFLDYMLGVIGHWDIEIVMRKGDSLAKRSRPTYEYIYELLTWAYVNNKLKDLLRLFSYSHINN